MRSPIEAGELLVEPALLVRLERVPVQRPALRRRLRLGLACPAPRKHAEHRGAAEHADDWQQPGKEVEAVPWRGGPEPPPPPPPPPAPDLAARGPGGRPPLG